MQGQGQGLTRGHGFQACWTTHLSAWTSWCKGDLIFVLWSQQCVHSLTSKTTQRCSSKSKVSICAFSNSIISETMFSLISIPMLIWSDLTQPCFSPAAELPGGQVPKSELSKTPRDEEDEELLFPTELSRHLVVLFGSQNDHNSSNKSWGWS